MSQLQKYNLIANTRSKAPVYYTSANALSKTPEQFLRKLFPKGKEVVVTESLFTKLKLMDSSIKRSDYDIKSDSYSKEVEASLGPDKMTRFLSIIEPSVKEVETASQQSQPSTVSSKESEKSASETSYEGSESSGTTGYASNSSEMRDVYEGYLKFTEEIGPNKKPTPYELEELTNYADIFALNRDLTKFVTVINRIGHRFKDNPEIKANEYIQNVMRITEEEISLDTASEASGRSESSVLSAPSMKSGVESVKQVLKKPHAFRDLTDEFNEAEKIDALVSQRNAAFALNEYNNLTQAQKDLIDHKATRPENLDVIINERGGSTKDVATLTTEGFFGDTTLVQSEKMDQASSMYPDTKVLEKQYRDADNTIKLLEGAFTPLSGSVIESPTPPVANDPMNEIESQDTLTQGPPSGVGPVGTETGNIDNVSTAATMGGVHESAVNVGIDYEGPHKIAVRMILGNPPVYDSDLTKNIKDLKLSDAEKIEKMDEMIRINGDRFLVQKRLGSSDEEFHAVSQLHFCVLRNLQRGPRNKQAMVNVAQLASVYNALGTTSSTVAGGLTSSTVDGDKIPADPYAEAGNFTDEMTLAPEGKLSTVPVTSATNNQKDVPKNATVAIGTNYDTKIREIDSKIASIGSALMLQQGAGNVNNQFNNQMVKEMRRNMNPKYIIGPGDQSDIDSQKYLSKKNGFNLKRVERKCRC